MTQSGEQSTLAGEFSEGRGSMHSFHKAVAISYSKNIEDPEKLEVQPSPEAPLSDHLFQMLFVLEGKASFRRRESDEECACIGPREHNLCCISPGSVRVTMASRQDEIICINLSSGFLNRYLSNHPAWQPFKAVRECKMPLMLAASNLHLTPEIIGILHRLEQTSQNAVFDQLLLESKALELLALQISQVEQLQNITGPAALKKEEMDKMMAARDILVNTPGKPLSLRSLAHLVGTNEFNLKRDFKIAFGSTVHGYLNQHKMELAKTMLVDKDMTIAEVASEMGYKYATHFSSAFKRYFGYLPSTVRSGRLSLMLLSEPFLISFENIGFLPC